MNKKFLFLGNAVILAITISVLTFSCKKKYDEPPPQVIPSGNPITIAALKSMYSGRDTTFKQDVNLYCTVIADETSGNFYKESYVRDATGAIRLRLLASGGLYVGDSIRINLKGAKLTQYQGVLQLDSINVDKMVAKQKTGLNPSPITLNITQINDNYLSQLIKLNNVEFICADKNQYFADATNQQSLNRTLKDCNGNQIIVRTSGYANFANQKTPTGNGSIIAIVGKYGGQYQLYIRNYNEVQMNGPGCSIAPTPTLSETFSSITTANVPISLPGWVNTSVNNVMLWKSDNAFAGGSNMTALASLFGASTNGAQDTLWLISPPIQATGSAQNLSFQVGVKYYDAGHPNLLSVMITTNYAECSSSTTWTTVPGFTIPSGNTTGMVPAGTVNLTPLLPPGYTGTFRIGFKHYGKKGTYDSNVYIDNITIN
jgi:hypothetical protein